MAKQGEIRLIIVPLNFLSSESTYATQALFCAERQDQEWEMHDAMFSVPQGYALSKENLKTLASQISGMDTNSFNSCLDNDETLAQAQQVMAKAQSAGFQISTPQFWVNGKQVQSSWTAIQAAINAA